MDVKRVEKPWGHEIWWAHTDRYVGKILFVKAGHQLSLQYHEKKDETVYLHRGSVILTVEEDGVLVEKRLFSGDAYHIRPGIRHRMRALEDSEILEASTPEVDDVVRLEDAYGRADRSRRGDEVA
ncbi:MAG TPA: cupin domain-containing protein [Fredinandcohnia sp.]|nr:cupin domain-containing protein [Fredinandcohnia sp.]